MSIISFLLNLPPVLMLALLITTFSGFGVIGTYLFKKYIKPKLKKYDDDDTGTGFTLVGGFYGILLAFVVFLVWGKFAGVQQDADVEGSISRALYRDIKFYPVEETDLLGLNEKKTVLTEFVNYIKIVLTEDSLLNTEGQKSPRYIQYRDSTTIAAFNNLFQLMEAMHDNSAYKNRRIDEMYKNLNELAKYRSLRNLSLNYEISTYIWIPLLLGGLITAILAFFLKIKNFRLHMMTNGLIGAFIALIFYIIILFDHPFQGKMRIDIKTGLENIMLDEKTK